MENRSVNADFFAQSKFRSSIFNYGAIVFGMDLLLCTLIIVQSWRHGQLTFQMAIYLAFLVFLLLAVWGHGTLTHELIHNLFVSGQMDKLEKDSAFDKVLNAAKRMITVGQFAAFAAVCCALLALGQ